jgi:hypothetical protein
MCAGHIIDEFVSALLACVSIAGALRDGLAFLLANAQRSNQRERKTGRLRSGLVVATTTSRFVLDWDGAPEVRALEGRFTEQPLFVDLHWAGEAQDLSLRNPDFLDCVATLAARLHGKPKRDIIGVDVAQHRRFRRIRRAAIASLGVVTALAILLGTAAEWQRGAAVSEGDLAEARQLTARAHETLGMAAASVAVTPTYEGTRILQRALHCLATPTEIRVCGQPARLAGVSRNGRRLAGVGHKNALRVCGRSG